MKSLKIIIDNEIHNVKYDYDGNTIWAVYIPGIISEGDTEEEAVKNFIEAYSGAVETYKAHKMHFELPELAAKYPPPQKWFDGDEPKPF